MSQQAHIKHKQFATKVMLELKTPAQAYAEVYDRDPKDRTTRVNASRLLTHADVQSRMDELSGVYENLALWALKQQLVLTMKPTTPAAVKNKIYESIITSSCYPKTHKVQMKVKHEREAEYPEFNMTPEELQAIINEAKPGKD
jgi:hypothetical protein